MTNIKLITVDGVFVDKEYEAFLNFVNSNNLKDTESFEWLMMDYISDLRKGLTKERTSLTLNKMQFLLLNKF